MRPRIRTVAASTPASELVPELCAALDGTGPALLPQPDGEPGRALLAAARVEEPLDDGIALLLPTSGSTGAPKVVELPAASLTASAHATHERLGGPGDWLLCLPPTHVAGWQALVRSVVAGTRCVQAAPGTFTVEAFATTAKSLSPNGPRYTALVPTQLARLLADLTGTRALAGFDGVLVGGAATPPALLARARDAGVVVHTTYGMTETSGGCVYDASPLAGVRIDSGDEGRVLLAGPVLAARYRGDPALTGQAFVTDAHGTRWFRTNDAGTLDGEGRLHLHGRLDDVVVTGGAKVSPAAVERVLIELDGVDEAIVVGVPDEQWGEVVVALVRAGHAPALDDVRAVVTDRLGRAAAPRHLLVVDALPQLGIGKPDRAAARRFAREHLA